MTVTADGAADVSTGSLSLVYLTNDIRVSASTCSGAQLSGAGGQCSFRVSLAGIKSAGPISHTITIRVGAATSPAAAK